MCIPNDRICDLEDDCGDASDEALALCEGRREDETFVFETFEEELHFLFINDPNNEGASWAWGTGNQSFNAIKGRAPLFDHTLFTEQGHYMILDMSQSQVNVLASASLLGALMEPPQDPNDVCRIRFYFHFDSQGGVNDMKLILGLR